MASQYQYRRRLMDNGASKVRKFMMTIREEMYRILERNADRRQVSLQELLRAVVIPEYIKGRQD